MTVTYLPAGSPTQRRIYAMYMTPDGTSLVKSRDGRSKYGGGVMSIIPAGTFRVLTVVLSYAQTFAEDALAAWSQAQAAINEQHASFARSKAYASPVVQFVFTNVTVPGAQVADPRSLQGIRAALAPRGTSTSGYDFVVVINAEPGRSEGGFAGAGGFVYMGNFGNWSTPLTQAQFAQIAASAYHHEIAHHWGWQHDWTPVCGGNRPFGPFITAPVLFGWEDTDGDGVPEILDTTPYGRSR
jgi:hypothetical protein